MKYLGIAIGVFSALVMWPFLPFLMIGALVIAAFKGLKQNAHGPKPAPMPQPAVRDPMFGDSCTSSEIVDPAVKTTPTVSLSTTSFEAISKKLPGLISDIV